MAISQLVAYMSAGVLLMLFEPTTTTVVTILIAAGVIGLLGACLLSDPEVEEEDNP